MELVSKLEKMIEGWLKPVPHLPEKGRKWLADNVWWLALVGVVLSVLGTISAVYSASVASRYVNYVNDLYKAWGVPGADSGFMGLELSLSMILMIVGVGAGAVLMGMAINPLKAKQKKGWDLMFLAMILSIAIQLVGVLFNLSTLISGILSAAVGAAIGSYFLFEVKPYFKKPEVAKEKKSE